MPKCIASPSHPRARSAAPSSGRVRVGSKTRSAVRGAEGAPVAPSPHARRCPGWAGRARRSWSALLAQLLPRVLHLRNRLELDVGQVPADPAHRPKILVLDDVARLG